MCVGASAVSEENKGHLPNSSDLSRSSPPVSAYDHEQGSFLTGIIVSQTTIKWVQSENVLMVPALMYIERRLHKLDCHRWFWEKEPWFPWTSLREEKFYILLQGRVRSWAGRMGKVEKDSASEAVKVGITLWASTLASSQPKTQKNLEALGWEGTGRWWEPPDCKDASPLGFRKLLWVSVGVRKWKSRYRNKTQPTLALQGREGSQGSGKIEHCLQRTVASLVDSYHSHGWLTATTKRSSLLFFPREFRSLLFEGISK